MTGIRYTEKRGTNRAEPATSQREPTLLEWYQGFLQPGHRSRDVERMELLRWSTVREHALKKEMIQHFGQMLDLHAEHNRWWKRLGRVVARRIGLEPQVLVYDANLQALDQRAATQDAPRPQAVTGDGPESEGEL